MYKKDKQELHRISESRINQLEGLHRGLLARHARNKVEEQ